MRDFVFRRAGLGSFCNATTATSCSPDTWRRRRKNGIWGTHRRAQCGVMRWPPSTTVGRRATSAAPQLRGTMGRKVRKRDGTATCTLSPGNTSLAGRQSLTMRYSPVHAGCAVSSSTASAALSQSIEVGAGARLFFSPTCGARYQRVQIHRRRWATCCERDGQRVR